MTETQFNKKIYKILDKLNWWYMKVHGNIYQRSGVPDILICANGGTFIGLECKRSNKAKVEPLQLWNIKNINDKGGLAYLIYPENYIEVFTDIFNKLNINIDEKGILK